MPRPRAGLFVFLAALPVACSAPAEPELHPVSGAISVNGVPLAAGTVSFRPDPPAAGHHPTGTVTNGRYELFTLGKPGAPPGRYKVLVFADPNADLAGNPPAHPKPPAWRTDKKYTTEPTTDLRAEVVAAPEPGRYDLKLTK